MSVSRRRPLAGRELWRIGDWGGASTQIGRRWEEIGATALGALVGQLSRRQPGFTPLAAVSFVLESACERAAQAAGLSHADALLIGPLDGRLALQPVDFKWSLEVADVSQIAGETLGTLLAAELPEVRQALVAQVQAEAWEIALHDSDFPPADELLLLDGLFLAPDHDANRAFLDSQVNLRQALPLAAHQVELSPVGGTEFFSPLAGWDVGVAIAAQEGARRALDTLEGAERYYRIGAGVRGALSAARRSIFEPEAPPIDALVELGQLRRAQRLTTTEQLIAYLDRLMSARSERQKAFRQLGRTIYPQTLFRKALRARGIVVPEPPEVDPEQRRWGRLYGLTQRELSGRLAVEGRALVAAGQNDAQALIALTARTGELARQAASIADRLIEAELVGRAANPSAEEAPAVEA
jgi:hypothetical protein